MTVCSRVSDQPLPFPASVRYSERPPPPKPQALLANIHSTNTMTALLTYVVTASLPDNVSTIACAVVGS